MKKIKNTKRNKIIGILSAWIFVCCLLVPNMQVRAENLLIHLSKDNVQKGDELTVSVTVPAGAAATVHLNYSPDVFSYRSSSGEVDEANGIVSALVAANAESQATFSVTFQAVSVGKGSFVASTDDLANLRSASVVVSVQDNPYAQISQPQENENNNMPADEGDGETRTENSESQEQKTWYELDGEKLYPSMMIPLSLVPDGFTEGTLTLWEEDYPCLYQENAGKEICLLYLVDENHENGALYMVAENAPYEVFPFVCVDYQTYKNLQDTDGSSPAEAGEDKNKKENTENIETLKSQNRLIIYAFIVVVLILLIIIVILMVKRREPWEEPEPQLSRPKKKPVAKKTVTKQKPEPKPEIPKKKPAARPKPEISPKEKQQKKKKSAFWDAMFAGIDDDIGFSDFEDEKLEPETPKREKPEKKIEKKPEKKQETQPKKQKNPDVEKGTDEDIEFIDL